MISIKTVAPHVALCSSCGGSGKMMDHEDITPVNTPGTYKRRLFSRNRASAIAEGGRTCPVCEGSGRVVVSTRTEYDIRPYRGNNANTEEL